MRKFLMFLNGAALLVAAKYGAWLALGQAPQELELIALDVGQGDALLVTVPQTSIQILVDGGPDAEVVEQIKKHLPAGDETIELVVLTHAHEDHAGGLPAVLDNFSVELVMDTGALNDNESYQLWREQIELLGIPFLYAVRGEKIRIGDDFSLEVLHPFYSPGAEYKNINEASVVLALDYQGQRALLAGDLEQEGEAEMIEYLKKKEKLGLLEAEVLKIGHHGSRTASSAALLDLVRPRKAIICVGENNQFGHPHEETMAKLKEREIEILRTDEGEERVGW